MLAIQSQRPGTNGDGLSLVEVPEPVPGTDDVLVEVLASTVNHSDMVTLSGAYASRTTFPFVPGFEGVGRVIAAGGDAGQALIGRRVLVLRGSGYWQQRRVANAADCIVVPDQIPTGIAAYAYINPMTALLLVRSIAPKAGSTALVSAPGSTMGRYLSVLLPERGVRVHGLSTGRSGQSHWPDSFTGVVAMTDPDWRTELSRMLPTGADWLIDSVGGTTLQALADLASPAAQIIQYGMLSGDRSLPESVTSGRTPFTYFHLRKYTYEMDHAEMTECFAEVFDHFTTGRFPAVEFDRVSLAGAIEAITSGRWNSRPKLLIDPSLG